MRMLACVVAAVVGSGCALGGGPMLAVGRRGVSFGGQAGWGAGYKNAIARVDAGFLVSLTDYDRRDGFAGATALWNVAPSDGIDGEVVASVCGHRDGWVLQAGGGVTNLDAPGAGWIITLDALYRGGELEAVLWAQLQAVFPIYG